MESFSLNNKIWLIPSIIFVVLMGISCQDSNSLFQKENKNWTINGDATWDFKENELIGSVSDGSGFIMTNEVYSDFILELEFKPDSTINSGVFLRCTNNDISPIDCYEINIWDLHPNQDYRTGAIVMKSVPLQDIETNYKWSKYKIKIKGDHIQVWLNEILTADHRDNGIANGYIALQATGTGEVRFRNIRINSIN